MDSNLYEKHSGVAGSINELATLVSEENNDVELQFQSADGKTIYGLSMHNYISILTTELNEIAEMSSKKSSFAVEVENYILEETGFRVRLKLKPMETSYKFPDKISQIP